MLIMKKLENTNLMKKYIIVFKRMMGVLLTVTFMIGCTDLDEELFSHILTQNSMAKIALLDWKGLGSQKQKVLDLLKSTELEIIKL